ncbi:MAG: DUF255 domain-containing protein [Sulfurovum sp.]|nr:DUF255 domain-containing protein [Sulfurovum sp.]
MKIGLIRCVVLLVGAILSLHAFSGEDVYQKKCASCHESYIPMKKLMKNFVKHKNRLLKLKAPTLNQLSYRLKQQIGDSSGDEDMHRMEVEAFIFDYLNHPNKQKTVCLHDVIQYFPVMPSMKGKISEEEVEAVSNYIYDFDKNMVEQKSVKYESFSVALKKVIKSNKIIMIEAVSKHCHFCKKMEREVMIDEGVVSVLKKDFVAVTVDISKNPLPMGLTAELTPTFFFINKDKNILRRIVGARNTEDFLQILKKVKMSQKGENYGKH